MAELETEDMGALQPQAASVPTERGAALVHGPLTPAMFALLTEGKSVWTDPKWGAVRLDRFDDSKRRAFTVGVGDEQVRLLVPKGTYLGEDVGDGWIAAPLGGWTENPVPGQRVATRFKGGGINDASNVSDAFLWPWSPHPGHAMNIIAFRLSNTPKHEATDAMGMESQRDEGPLSEKSGEADAVLKVAIDDLEWMLEEIKSARPGTYRASGTIEDLKRLRTSLATTQPAEQSASSPVEGEGYDPTGLLDDPLTTRSVAVSSEAVARVRRILGRGEVHEATRIMDAIDALDSLLNQARKPEGVRTEARDRAAQAVCGANAIMGRETLSEGASYTLVDAVIREIAHPAHEAGEVERLRGIARKLSASISWLDEPFIDANTKEPELRSRIGFMMKDAAEARAALEDKS